MRGGRGEGERRKRGGRGEGEGRERGGEGEGRGWEERKIKGEEREARDRRKKREKKIVKKEKGDKDGWGTYMTIEEVREMLATILIDFVIEGFAPAYTMYDIQCMIYTCTCTCDRTE